MPLETVRIVDRERSVVATADVASREGCYSGSVHVDQMPEPLRRVFEEYEDLVNNQVFGLLDEVEDRIDGLALSIVFEDGRESPLKDLQIFPKGGTVSFKATEPAMLGGGR